MKPLELDFDIWDKSGLLLEDFILLQLAVECRHEDSRIACRILQKKEAGVVEQYMTTDDLGVAIPTKEGLTLFKNPENIGSWIDEWRKKFPEGESDHGYRWRSPKPGCLKKMKTFIKKHKATKDDIFKATDNYLRRFNGDFTYCKTASNFIYKDNVDESELLSQIDGLESVVAPTINRERTL